MKTVRKLVAVFRDNNGSGRRNRAGMDWKEFKDTAERISPLPQLREKLGCGKEHSKKE